MIFSTLASLLAAAVALARADAYTDGIAAGNHFRLRHPNGKYWSLLDANDVVWDKPAKQLRLNKGTVQTYTTSLSANTFNTNESWTAIVDASGSLVRHAGYVMWHEAFSGPNYDFSYKFAPVGLGIVQIRNPYDGGHVVGYDASSDRVLIVRASDPRAVNWTVEFAEPNAVLDKIKAGARFRIKHGSGRAWGSAKMGDTWWGNAADRLMLSGGTPSTYVLSARDNTFEPGAGWTAIKNEATGQLVRHAGYVMWEEVFCGPNYDFSYSFEPVGENQFRITNPYDGGHVVGYDAGSDRVQIVRATDARATLWTIELDGQPPRVRKCKPKQPKPTPTPVPPPRQY
ncbi:hypothetical protein HK105_204403 [Polyrhizophydium stewartii]|uniref:Uncharacterized protein n=1 Tax=Polyrhizophydium stewartii TaxID=2732419 RepID=A0ABR4N954_9FUNG